MPQMMPINWLLSFFFFIMIFILFNIMNYYIFNINNFKNLFYFNKKNFKNMNWKW
uniref:ATP synthase F0 subunit 8 n=1 Tax=Parnassius schultei TaxID=213964 RepID=UPI0023D7D09C|nr:ATP synthase F0 subunit 8 [Parnassius schultei]YP_010722419.1 ATP synthase F0 subunit 8 [Parnassius andreji]WDE75817.1 ATP synthase F0 subunit 8 [Parnassius schultei]WDV10572.1 ATP synthase F0 subunit 8 [Parnassius andreji]